MKRSLWLALFVSFVLTGCSSMQFMAGPRALEAERRAACEVMQTYSARAQCLAECRELTRMRWAEEMRADREQRTPSSLADDPNLALAVFGG